MDNRCNQQHLGIAILISGLLVLIIGLIAAIGILTSGDGELMFLANWGKGPPMALPTAACFLLVGSALILIAGMFRRLEKQ